MINTSPNCQLSILRSDALASIWNKKDSIEQYAQCIKNGLPIDDFLGYGNHPITWLLKVDPEVGEISSQTVKKWIDFYLENDLPQTYIILGLANRTDLKPLHIEILDKLDLEGSSLRYQNQRFLKPQLILANAVANINLDFVKEYLKRVLINKEIASEALTLGLPRVKPDEKSIEMACLLQNYGAEIIKKDDDEYEGFFHILVKSENIEGLQTWGKMFGYHLLEERNKSDETPFWLAAIRNRPIMVANLIECGAQVNTKRNGRMLILECLKPMYKEVVKAMSSRLDFSMRSGNKNKGPSLLEELRNSKNGEISALIESSLLKEESEQPKIQRKRRI